MLTKPIPPELRTKMGTCRVDAELLRDAIEVANPAQLEAIARLLFVEGIPAAFKKFPLMYEHFRCALAEGLGVAPRDVSITGSGRLGFSAAPDRWGKRLGTHSDLDVFVVSPQLHAGFIEAEESWLAANAAGASPGKLKNIRGFLRKLRNYGFGDAKYLNLGGHSDVRARVVAAMRGAYRCFDAHGWQPVAQKHRKNSKGLHLLNLRVYRDWQAVSVRMRHELAAGRQARREAATER